MRPLGLRFQLLSQGKVNLSIPEGHSLAGQSALASRGGLPVSEESEW